MKNLRFVIFVTFLIWLSSQQLACISAKKSSKSHKKKPKTPRPPPPPRGPPPPPLVPSSVPSSDSSTFNVLDYGAKGDRVADDTNAFLAAWGNACIATGSVLLVPSGSVFLVKPITFLGTNCLPNIIFQVDGKIIAPQSSGSWKSGLLEWLNFSKLKGFTIRGQGVIDGQGSVWWKSNGNMPSTKPTAVRFYGSTDITVTGITIQNSPQTHLKFDFSNGIQVYGVSISSPGDSPNTDGIHLQSSQAVVIRNTTMSCGDDCVSIQTGCSNVYIHDVHCGPGHGISIGGLGQDETKSCVSNITVRDTIMQNTLTGVRIKTWPGGSGTVQGIMFSNIQVSEVETPIIIDQFYCNSHSCPNKTSAVAISGVNYQSITGTYTKNPVQFWCSDSIPCAGITLSTIQLTPSSKAKNRDPSCWKAFGELKTATTPPISCLKTGFPSNSPGIASC